MRMVTRTTRWWLAVFLAVERAIVGDGLVGVEVVEAVLDEVRALHAGEDEEVACSRVELLLHGLARRGSATLAAFWAAWVVGVVSGEEREVVTKRRAAW